MRHPRHLAPVQGAQRGQIRCRHTQLRSQKLENSRRYVFYGAQRCPGQPQESQLKCGTQAQAGPEGPSNVRPFNPVKREELPQLEISQLRRESTPTKVWELCEFF